MGRARGAASRAAIACALVAWPASGAEKADSRPPPQEPPPTPKDARGYGTAVAVAYAVPLGVSSGGVLLSMLNVRGGEIHTDPLLYSFFAVPVGLVAPPVTHWAHGNFWGGLGSLAGNGAAFFVGGVSGGVLGSSLCKPENYTLCTVHGWILGAAVLQGAWGVIDVSELAKLPPDGAPRESHVPAPRVVLQSVELAFRDGVPGFALRGCF